MSNAKLHAEKASILVRKHDEWHESHIGLFDEFVKILEKFEHTKNTEQCDELINVLKEEIETVCIICSKKPDTMCNTCEGVCSRTKSMQDAVARIIK